MQIHELNRPRRTNEGFMDVIKAAKTGLAQAVSPGVGTTQDFRASSAGILDPKQKLAAVMKNSEMADLAAKYADAWLTDKRSQVSAAPAAAPTPNFAQQGGYAKVNQPTSVKYNMPAGSGSNVQRESAYYNFDHILESIININEKAAVADRPVTKPAATSAAPTTAPGFNYNNVMKMPGMEKYATPAGGTQPVTKPATNTVNAPGFNYNNVMKMPGMEKYATPAATSATNAATDAQAQTSPAATSRINKANPDNPNIKDQNRYVQGRAGSGTGGDATKFAKYNPATSATANAAQGINNMVKGGVAAQQPATTTAKPNYGTQTGAGAKVTYNQPTGVPDPLAKISPATVASKPPAGQTRPAADSQTSAGQAKPDASAQTPDNPEYIKNFLEFANEKVAMRDSATYKMLGLRDAEGVPELKPELDAAKEKVKSAQGNPAATKTAVKNYILIAMAALQLVASQNAVKAASPEAPAYGQQPAPAGQAGKAGQSGADGAAAGTAPAAGQITGSNAVALLKQAGLTAQILTIAGEKIQKETGNKQLSTTGDSVIDTMLEGMGYTVA
jgi:hypothetical protein